MPCVRHRRSLARHGAAERAALAVIVVALFGGTLIGQSPAIRVTLLGTAGPSMAIDRAESGTLVQAGGETLLFDCGRGVPERLVQLGIGNVSKVFLTHLHSDHTQGLPILWMGGWNARGSTSVSLWGPTTDADQPSGTAFLAQALTIAYATNTHIRRDLVEKLPAAAIVFDAHEIKEGVVYQSNGVVVTAFHVDHAPVSPAFGYRVDYAGHSVAISGDTRPSDNLVRFAKGVDVLVHEVFLGQAGGGGAVAAYHTSPEQAADVFNRVAPGLAVYSHLTGGQGDPTARTRAAGYRGPLQVGSDLTAISIGDRISVTSCESAQTPVVSTVTDAASAPTLSAGGSVVVSGSGFSSKGGNQVIFTRAGGAGAPAPVVFDAATDPTYADQSATLITVRLGGRVTPGSWAVSVKNGCGVTSAGLTVTLQ